MGIDIEKLKYPIGKFTAPENIDGIQVQQWIQIIQQFPQKLRNEVAGLSDKELEQQYRPQGWTIRQVVHHCADSHMNSFIRFKLALTENTPVIKPYFEDLWAELPDTKNLPISSSLKMLEGIHERWAYLLANLSENELARQFIHPENQQLIQLKTNIGIYAWHCEHHFHHILIAKENKRED